VLRLGLLVLGRPEAELAGVHEVVQSVLENVLRARAPAAGIRLGPEVSDVVGAADLERDQVIDLVRIGDVRHAVTGVHRFRTPIRARVSVRIHHGPRAPAAPRCAEDGRSSKLVAAGEPVVRAGPEVLPGGQAGSLGYDCSEFTPKGHIVTVRNGLESPWVLCDGPHRGSPSPAAEGGSPPSGEPTGGPVRHT
jgi:hypothetical protein